MANLAMTAIRRWWQRFYRRRSYGPVGFVESLSAVPTRPKGTIFVVNALGSPKWAVLACPCRCGDQITVNLMRHIKPSWSATVDHGRLTLRPSLWRGERTCRSHFFIRSNRVTWIDEM